MTASTSSSSMVPVMISEIFPVVISQPNVRCFRLTPNVDETAKDLGNRLSFHLSRCFPDLVVIWYRGVFFALAKPGQVIPEPLEWRDALESIHDEVKDLSDCQWGIQWVRQTELTPEISSQLARQILKTNCKFSQPLVPLPKNEAQQVIVRREVQLWPEIIELDNISTPALSLSIRSSILSKGDLAKFFQDHPSRQNPEKLLIGIHVQSIEMGGHGVIRQLTGTIGEKREGLIQLATGSTSKQALLDAPDDQPVVGVQFGKNSKIYEYAMSALRPRLTSDTDERFDVQYGQLLRATKIHDFRERTQLLQVYKKEASETLEKFGYKIGSSINSNTHESLFWYPKTPINQTPLLFGKGYIGQQGQILKGLNAKNGGVYRCHSDYKSNKIQITILKLCDFIVNPLIEQIQASLKNYGFQSSIVEKVSLKISSNEAATRAELEKALNHIAAFSPDLVLILLPESDRHTDNNDGGSLYQFAYSHLLRRSTASQFIYEDTLKKADHRQILNQTIPGILAKLGNLPFVLAQPLEIADYFIGLDVSRSSKSRLPGTVNACASIRLYHSQGEFIRYRLEDGLLEGEEIPQRMLERLLPASELAGKTVLIYRDGHFCGKEVTHLLERAEAIQARFILVESVKSGVPRLYHYNSAQKVLAPPDTGLALRLSSREAILVTTKVTSNVGLSRPLRLRIHEQGHQALIEQVVETTLKLTLLHHGALKTPRLPMPLYGADRMAYLKISGIYPSVLDGDRQFWL
jgi:Piwi domain